MPVRSWFRFLPQRRQRVSFESGNCYLPLEAFQHQTTCERMRVDRNGSVLALLTIELPEYRRSPEDYQYLASLLRKRLRITDTAGQLMNGRIGVLLPDTDESGAWKVASDICDDYDVGRHRPSCDVIIYPEGDQREAGRKSCQEVPAEADASESVGSGLEAFQAAESPPWKRVVDVIGASIGLVLTGPLILAAAAVIKLTSRGPLIYAQEREGLGGRRFQIYKLRTMYVGADEQRSSLQDLNEQDGPAFKIADDPRIVPLGRWLRLLSIDELPQFWNVLRGDMSLVGPRPLPTDESLQCVSWQRRRLQVRPGMTCIWQIRGRNSVSFNEWVRMDLEYMRRRSFWYDLRLMAETVPALVRYRGPR